MINDPEFLAILNKLKQEDPDRFMELVLEALKTEPDFAVEDDVPVENKRSALKRIREYFESQEKYEDCAFIRDLQKRIEDAEEGCIPDNE